MVFMVLGYNDMKDNFNCCYETVPEEEQIR